MTSPSTITMFGADWCRDCIRTKSQLDGLGIEHSGVRDIADPVPFSTLVFRDPDNIQLEFIHTP